MTLLAPSPAQSERQRMAAMDYATAARIHRDSPSEAFAEELQRRDADMDGAFREGIREIDDAQLFQCLKYPRIAAIAREEVERRRRYEMHWTVGWSSGPDVPIQKPSPIPAHWNRPRKQKSFSGRQQDRAEVRKLWSQVRDGNKVQKAAAIHILRTRYGQSVS